MDTKNLEWLIEHMDRYIAINDARDKGKHVASFEKEFIAKYDRKKLKALKEIGQ